GPLDVTMKILKTIEGIYRVKAGLHRLNFDLFPHDENATHRGRCGTFLCGDAKRRHALEGRRNLCAAGPARSRGCARAATGHAAAGPPSSVMNSRRLTRSRVVPGNFCRVASSRAA